jgi:hypothetical protein
MLEKDWYRGENRSQGTSDYTYTGSRCRGIIRDDGERIRFATLVIRRFL